MPEFKPGHCHKCGMPLLDNPHPEAGKPEHVLEVGCQKECLPCTVLSRHTWAGRAQKAESELREAKQRIAELEAARRAYASEFAPTDDGEPDVGSIHANIRKLKQRIADLEQDAALLNTDKRNELIELLATMLHFIPKDEPLLYRDVERFCGDLRAVTPPPAE